MVSRLTFSQVLAAIGSLIAALIFFFPVGSLGTQSAQIAGLTLFMIVFWATNVIPPYLTVLIFFAIAMLFKVIPPELAFSGFGSGAFWLVFGGLVIGAAVKQTGLAMRIANAIAGYFGSSYRRIVGGMILMGMALSFIMPSSMGRVVLLVPIAVALAERYQFSPDSPGRYGIIMAAILGTHLPSFAIITANVPNVILMGTSESIWNITVSYGAYFLMHYPVLGILKAVLIYVLLLYVFPDTLPETTESDSNSQTPMSPAEKRLAVIMAGVLLMWGFDFVHGISPAWIGLGAAVILLLPGIGILKPEAFNKDISYSSLFFVAGIIALGTIIAQSELSVLFSDWVKDALPLSPGADFSNYMVLSLTAIVISMVGTVPTVPAIMVPLADVLSSLSGIPIVTVIMINVVGFSTIFFPYQAPPLIIGVLLAKIPVGRAIRLTVILSLLTIIVLLPLDYLWLQLLGKF